MSKHFCTLGMFIIDEFEYRDEEGTLLQGPLATRTPQVGGGGTYAAIGARIFLQPSQVGMVVDQGTDFPPEILTTLLSFGDMWLFRRHGNKGTTRALNKYIGQRRGFEYLTPRIRVTPKDLGVSTSFSRPSQLHFICSPARAAQVIEEINSVEGWKPLTIFEPVPDRCIAEELPSLLTVLPQISILSPNAGEALSLLGRSDGNHPTRDSVQQACTRFLEFGVGEGGDGYVIIRSGALGAYVARRGEDGFWIDAYWQESDQSDEKVVDVTGAGNAFLGGLSAGLLLTHGDVRKAAFYASVASSFAIEQFGLPCLQIATGTWNHDDPMRRLRVLQARHAARDGQKNTNAQRAI